ncbi:MAG TPA: Ig-like domain-containing protein, partial [Gemmatimonadaceae bacterium]
MRSTTSVRCLLIAGAVLAASCHHDLGPASRVADISLAPTNFSLLVGDTITIAASASDSSGILVAGVTPTWSSSDTTIATVNNFGLVTGIKVGSVSITATAGPGAGTTKVTVVAALPPSISSITITPTPAFVAVHGTQQLAAVVRDSAGNPIPGLTVNWQSNNPSVATVSSTGLVSGLKAGAVVVSASIGGFLGTSNITVQTVITLGPSSVVVAPATATVGIGRSVQFSATATDSTGNTFPNATATWSSNNTAAVTVSASGLATGVAAGTATISGTAFGGVGTATVTVEVLNFTAVSAGDLHSCTLATDGSAWCFGGDEADQLGDSTEINSNAPVATKGGLHFAAISSGYAHNCGLTTSGSAAYCWGDNLSGELGDGTTAHRATPVAVTGGQTFTSISAGEDHTCGLTAAGVAWCWGNNQSGQLGNGQTVNSPSPVAVSGAITFASISAGFQNTCGVSGAGAVYCWGDNTRGQLGNGTLTASATPVAVT